MEFGKVEYFVSRGVGPEAVRVLLTLIGQGDEDALRLEGLAGLRRKRIVRLTREAAKQGVLLGYDDLSGLLLTSLATLKRDVGHLESRGVTVSLRGRRGNGTGGANG